MIFSTVSFKRYKASSLFARVYVLTMIPILITIFSMMWFSQYNANNAYRSEIETINTGVLEHVMLTTLDSFKTMHRISVNLSLSPAVKSFTYDHDFIGDVGAAKIAETLKNYKTIYSYIDSIYVYSNVSHNLQMSKSYTK